MPVRHVTLVEDEVLEVGVAGQGGFAAVGILHEGNVASTVLATVNGEEPTTDADDVYYVFPGSRREIDTSRLGDSVLLRCPEAARIEVEFS